MSLALASRRAAISPAWVKSPLWGAARAVPSLDLQFANTKSLADAVTGQSLITFTRASSATYVGSDGVLRTAAVNEPRFDHNPTTGESLGLLVEEQRTNLVLNSATFQPTSAGTPAAYTVDQVAPDGTTKGSRQTAANPRTFVDYTGIPNALYTFSFYCRVTSGTAVLSIQLKNAATDTVITSDTSPVATTTWRRFTISGTTTGATTGARIELVGVVPGFVFWGAQLEAGAFATSYIPTTTAAATRSADVASITGTAFSSWYRQDEGTMFYDGTVSQSLAAFPWFYNISDGTVNNSIGVYQFTNGIYGSVVAGGVASTPDPALLFSPVAGSSARVALAVKALDTRSTFNGTLSSAQTSTVMPVVNTLSIGQRVIANRTTGTIRRLAYFPQRLPNSTLQAITQ